ncbi:unnamed protein product [Spirodela intermedia]|nr:unnamed protein product [Spirodela intermedia]CAA6661789.1 unnamed protein product [Spirodela intermedia]
MYLRSYTFSRKESVPERTRRCLGKMKKKVGGIIVNGNMTPGCCCVGRMEKKRKKKKEKEKCGVVRRLREVSLAAVRSIFLRLLACTASVDLGNYQASS